MRRVAIIPARGGSKRLPRKNIIDFFGKPIIAWTIEAAKQSNLFDAVIVSTEDDEIKDIARKYGAEIDDRAQELATDDARVLDVCVDLLNRENMKDVDILCVLYATAPLRSAQDIQKTVELLSRETCDFALACTTYDLPVHQALKVNDNADVRPMWPELIEERSSDIGTVVVDNGSTYAVFVPAFLNEKTFYGPNLKAHIMPREFSQDIDEEHDLELAKFYGQKFGLGHKS
jgi:pseudaminic acid cytidylyltransferase